MFVFGWRTRTLPLAPIVTVRQAFSGSPSAAVNERQRFDGCAKRFCASAAKVVAEMRSAAERFISRAVIFCARSGLCNQKHRVCGGTHSFQIIWRKLERVKGIEP